MAKVDRKVAVRILEFILSRYNKCCEQISTVSPMPHAVNFSVLAFTKLWREMDGWVSPEGNIELIGSSFSLDLSPDGSNKVLYFSKK